MAAPADPSNGSPTGRRRRSSFTEMFARPSIDTNAANTLNSSGPRTSSMANAMQQRARRMSITSIGLSGSPNGQNTASAFDTLKGSQGSAAPRPAAIDSEDAVEDDDEVPPLDTERRPQSPSIGRRLSFGTRAYRSSSGASSNGDTGASETSGGSPNGPGSPGGTRKGESASPSEDRTRRPTLPSAALFGGDTDKDEEGFNWSENLRQRAQRSSLSAGSGNAGFMPLSGIHSRSKSVADPSAAAATPAQPPPAPPPAPKAPDHFQERILKGDFYMD